MPTPSLEVRAAGAVPGVSARLTREHFRFLSGVVQGLDARALWDRYLFALGPADLRRIRSVTVALHDQLGALARRAGRPAVADLLRRRSLPETAAAPGLTLDEFSATLPTDMHSEAELLALWKEAHARLPSHRPAQRRLRLIEQQLDALRWLESVAVAAPGPNDAVADWLAPQVAQRLAAVGIETLTALQRWIDLHGHHWHRRVPRIGAHGAARIVRWLAGHADTLGALPAHALHRARSSTRAPSLRCRWPAWCRWNGCGCRRRCRARRARIAPTRLGARPQPATTWRRCRRGCRGRRPPRTPGAPTAAKPSDSCCGRCSSEARR